VNSRHSEGPPIANPNLTLYHSGPSLWRADTGAHGHGHV